MILVSLLHPKCLGRRLKCEQRQDCSRIYPKPLVSLPKIKRIYVSGLSLSTLSHKNNKNQKDYLCTCLTGHVSSCLLEDHKVKDMLVANKVEMKNKSLLFHQKLCKVNSRYLELSRDLEIYLV